jgi:enoyl-CoA hydratase/carnithine racemase
MTEPAAVVSQQGPVATIALNRPGNRNAMSSELLDAFAAAVAAVRAQQDVRAVVLAGSGGIFSAGADLKDQLQRKDAAADRSGQEKSYAMYQPFLDVLSLEVPVIGALTGHAVGGGFGLALCCDLRVAQRDAKYGANFVRLGIHPGMAITWLLPRLVGVPKAMELLLTGQLFTGEEGADWGVFNRCAAKDDVLPVALDLARTIADNAPLAVRLTKQSVYRGMHWDPKGAAWHESFAQALTVGTDDAAEGVTAMLAKRKPQFHGR